MKTIKKIVISICKPFIYLWFKIYNRLEIKGVENIPKEGALIFCANHKTFLDPPVMLVTSTRKMRFLAKEELAKNPFLNMVLYFTDTILVRKNEKEIVPMKEALRTLKSEECIAIFPEGTRNGIEKGEKIKDGVAFLAVRSGAKVLPCGIKGGNKQNRKVTITYGKPLDYSQYKGSKDREVLDKITNEIMENILQLSQ